MCRWTAGRRRGTAASERALAGAWQAGGARCAARRPAHRAWLQAFGARADAPGPPPRHRHDHPITIVNRARGSTRGGGAADPAPSSSPTPCPQDEEFYQVSLDVRGKRTLAESLDSYVSKVRRPRCRAAAMRRLPPPHRDGLRMCRAFSSSRWTAACPRRAAAPRLQAVCRNVCRPGALPPPRRSSASPPLVALSVPTSATPLAVPTPALPPPPAPPPPTQELMDGQNQWLCEELGRKVGAAPRVPPPRPAAQRAAPPRPPGRHGPLHLASEQHSPATCARCAPTGALTISTTHAAHPLTYAHSPAGGRREAHADQSRPHIHPTLAPSLLLAPHRLPAGGRREAHADQGAAGHAGPAPQALRVRLRDVPALEGGC